MCPLSVSLFCTSSGAGLSLNGTSTPSHRAMAVSRIIRGERRGYRADYLFEAVLVKAQPAGPQHKQHECAQCQLQGHWVTKPCLNILSL